MNKSIITLLVCAAFVGFSSCKTHKSAAVKCETTPTYSADIKPIIDANCANSCHSATRKAHQLDLSAYQLVKATAADRSFLGSMKHESGFTPMPKNKPQLDEASIKKIECWISNGLAE